MPTRTTKLVSIKPAAGTPTSTLTVPTGMTYLVKSVLVYNAGGAADTVFVWGQDVGGVVGAIIQSLSVAANGRAEWDGFVSLNAGDQLFVQAALGTSQFWATGAKLVGVA